MRFIKRLIFVIVLLLIAFFIYNLISPKAANSLLHDLKSFSNTTIGTQFSLSGQTLVSSGVALDIAGTTLEETGALQEITGDEEILLSDSDFQENLDTGTTATGTVSLSTGIVATGSSVTTSATPPVVAPKLILPPKKTTTTSSSQEQRDFNNFLKNFGN